MEHFIGPCPEALSTAVRPLAELLQLPTLTLHVHHVLGAALVYQAIYLIISPTLSKIFLSERYNSFPKRTQINWDVHVVSFIQSTFICAIALWGMFFDEERAPGLANTEDATMYRVFGYSVTGGAVQGYATGYFLWDLFICIYHFKIMGFGFLAHAVSALAVFCMGFRPFVNFYAPIFILFELSSPFLNIHWFCDKLGLTGGKIQLVNGLCLIGTFFCCRLLWGTYNSVLVFKDIFSIYASPPPAAQDLLAEDALAGKSVEVHPFAGKTVPLWLAVVYLGSNLTLNGLNYYWFSRMITTVASRFTKPAVDAPKEKAFVEGTEVDLSAATSRAVRDAEKLRKRVKA